MENKSTKIKKPCVRKITPMAVLAVLGEIQKKTARWDKWLERLAEQDEMRRVNNK